MADEHHNRPIIIKRIKKINKHHGGSWKIAYADFVTAMMSFFLLMWLLSLLNKYQLQGIAEYFQKPFKEVFTQQDKIHPKTKVKLQKIEPPPNKAAGEKESKEERIKKIEAMKNQIMSNLNKNPQLSQYKNSLNFVVTADGLKIELRDLEDKPMFSEGNTDFQSYAKEIVSWLSQQLNGYPNNLIIIGHTDSIPYNGGANYTNWELSADRANSTRRELVNSGMDENKIIRVIGASDTNLLDKENSFDPKNRRIEIIVLTNEAAEKMKEQ